LVDEAWGSSVIIDLLGTPAGEVRVDRQDAHTLVLTVPGAQLSDNAPRTLDTAEYMGPVLRVQMKQISGAVRVTVDLADEVKASVRRVGSRLYWDFGKQNPGPRGNATRSNGGGGNPPPPPAASRAAAAPPPPRAAKPAGAPPPSGFAIGARRCSRSGSKRAAVPVAAKRSSAARVARSVIPAAASTSTSKTPTFTTSCASCRTSVRSTSSPPT